MFFYFIFSLLLLLLFVLFALFRRPVVISLRFALFNSHFNCWAAEIFRSAHMAGFFPSLFSFFTFLFLFFHFLIDIIEVCTFIRIMCTFFVQPEFKYVLKFGKTSQKLWEINSVGRWSECLEDKRLSRKRSDSPNNFEIFSHRISHTTA